MPGKWKAWVTNGYGERVRNPKPNPRAHKTRLERAGIRTETRPEWDSPSRNLAATCVGLHRLQGERPLSGIASDLGVHPSYLSRVWAGKRVPSLQVTRRLAAVLGVGLEELASILLGESDGADLRPDTLRSATLTLSPAPTEVV
jgi:transcriptional regulator with XRE-family HTH domain